MLVECTVVRSPRSRALAPLLLLVVWAPVFACGVEEDSATTHLRSGTSSPEPTSGADGGSPPPPTGSGAPTSSASPAPTAVADASTDAETGTPKPKDAGTPTNPPGADPCAGVTCPAGKACVSEAHGQPLGVCVDTCDCSNCGNCAYDNSDGRWDDQQEYCGNLEQSPATVTCNRPCKSGLGCIYYGDVNICWPLEGCFSK